MFDILHNISNTIHYSHVDSGAVLVKTTIKNIYQHGQSTHYRGLKLASSTFVLSITDVERLFTTNLCSTWNSYYIINKRIKKEQSAGKIYKVIGYYKISRFILSSLFNIDHTPCNNSLYIYMCIYIQVLPTGLFRTCLHIYTGSDSWGS